MKPLQTGAPTVRLPLQQARALLEGKKWSAAQALLDDLERTSPVDRHSPEYGEWCILQARVGVAAGEYRDAVRYGRSALRIFQSTSADAALAETHRVLGSVYLGLGESKSARIHTRDALAIYRQIDDATGMMQSANDLARVHFVRGEYDLAVDHLTDAIDLARQVGNAEKGAVFTGSLGRIRLL
ncbi:MAG: tetratricopeptide repeat protein, partial [Planctomycetes bacterium]|nr:tetratricopeptide repeat protein [Planctomycetota bacterium]